MDKKHKKKLKRAVKKKKEKAASEQLQNKLKQQMNMFDRLPETCSACAKVFPKTREAHMTCKAAVENNNEV